MSNKKEMKLIAFYEKRLAYSEKAFKEAVVAGFFIGFGIVLNLIPALESGALGKVGAILITIIIGFSFWGIGFNLLALLLSSILSWLLQIGLKVEVEKEKIFMVLVWSHVPLTLGILSGLIRLVDARIDVSGYALLVLELVSLVLLISKGTAQLKKDLPKERN